MKKIFWIGLNGTLQGRTNKRVLPGAKEAVEYLYRSGFKIIGVKNQRREISLSQEIKEQRNTLELFPEMEFIYLCPLDGEGSYCYRLTKNTEAVRLQISICSEYQRVSCQKPGHGMFLLSSMDSVTDRKEMDWEKDCWIVGDWEDQLCAAATGVNFIYADIFRSRFGGDRCEEPDFPTKMIQEFNKVLTKS
jgi:hypothetical protein